MSRIPNTAYLQESGRYVKIILIIDWTCLRPLEVGESKARICWDPPMPAALRRGQQNDAKGSAVDLDPVGFQQDPDPKWIFKQNNSGKEIKFDNFT